MPPVFGKENFNGLYIPFKRSVFIFVKIRNV